MARCPPDHCPPVKEKGPWIEIGQKDLPFVATEGGNYQLKENVTFGSTFQPAITFNGGQAIVFDLNSFTIDLVQTGIQAISANNIDQLQIRNGQIINGAVDNIQPILNPTPPDIVDAAIRIRGSSNVVLKNLNIDHVLYGVVGTDMLDDVVVEDCQIFHFGVIAPLTFGNSTFNDPVGAGLFFSGRNVNQKLKDVTVKNCQIQSETGFSSVFLNFVDGASVEGCAAAAGRIVRAGQNTGCFTFTNSSSLVYKNCTTRFSSQQFFGFQSSGIKILNNQLANTSQDGIEMVFCNNAVVEGNSVSRTLDEPTLVSPGSGIKIQVCELITIRTNNVSGFTVGNLTTDANGAGIAVVACKGCIIDNNDVSGNNFGIKQVLGPVPVGPPPNNIFTGLPSLFTRNVAFVNLIQAYVGLNPALVASITNASTSWFNVFP